MQNLTKNSALPFTSEEIIRNLSSYSLNKEENDILKKGLSYSLPPYKLRKSDIIISFEMMYRFKGELK